MKWNELLKYLKTTTYIYIHGPYLTRYFYNTVITKKYLLVALENIN